MFGCYLFNCGSPSVCSFSSHVGYSSFHMVTDVVDTHASDLANLAPAPSSTDTSAGTTVPSTVINTVTGLYYEVNDTLNRLGDNTKNVR